MFLATALIKGYTTLKIFKMAGVQGAEYAHWLGT
jgi:hypothetical protein